MEKNGLPPAMKKGASDEECPEVPCDQNEVMKKAEDMAEEMFIASPVRRKSHRDRKVDNA